MSERDKVNNKLRPRIGRFGKIIASLVSVYESRRGPVYAQRRHKKAVSQGRSIQRGLEHIRSRWPDVKSTTEDGPVFILSAGWRSGSTLVQRLVNSGQSILVWGEPYSHARIVRHLAAAVSSITADWPEDDWFIDTYELDNLTDAFTANMYPDVQDMLESCLAYMRVLFEEPARRRGYSRWGVKDVRISIDEAHFLRWLYPKAKIILICRNPYEAYQSYRMDRSWYKEWPDKPVFTADRFGRHWRELVEGFQAGWDSVNGIFIRYEDLCTDARTVVRLEEYLDMSLDKTILGRKVGTHQMNNIDIPRIELRMLRKEVSAVAAGLGYATVN